MKYVERVVDGLKRRDPGQPEFHQAVGEVFGSLAPILDERPEYEEAGILERLAEPDRVIVFRVTWLDDAGRTRVNRGFRVQATNVLGPYKGGLRFHPTVNLSILKFLGFEQIFKNALTTLPLGAGKGGSDFDPKGKSDTEVMRFCQSFMTELSRHIGPDTDVPAGDIGVGAREIGFLYGQYKRLTNEVTGVLTGKSVGWGGSLIRPEATGYGTVYFASEMLKAARSSLDGQPCVISGSGNVAQYTCRKLLELGAKPVSMSDSGGTVYDKDGIDEEKLEWIMDLKNRRRGRIHEYASEFKCEYREEDLPWDIPCFAAFPSATQNEVDVAGAKSLVANGCRLLAEGANMPCTPEAVDVLRAGNVLYGPGKAANAGGVAVSGLEMSQNAMRLNWLSEEVDSRLASIMKQIHEDAYAASERYGDEGNYVLGANAAGFTRVADAMIDQGVV